MWNFGSLLAFCLIIQIITGVTLAMHYNPSVAEAFNSRQTSSYSNSETKTPLIYLKEHSLQSNFGCNFVLYSLFIIYVKVFFTMFKCNIDSGVETVIALVLLSILLTVLLRYFACCLNNKPFRLGTAASAVIFGKLFLIFYLVVSHFLDFHYMAMSFILDFWFTYVVP